MTAPSRMSAADYRAMVGAPTPTSNVPAPVAAMNALGRLPSGQMNHTEELYSGYLECRRRAGEVQWFAFERITFRIADNCRYTPDFLVLFADGRLEAHEVKGHWRDDARVKIKVAAGHFPIGFVAVTKIPSRDGGGWREERFS